MKKMKKFFMYFLLLLGFFIFSSILEYGNIQSLYNPITGDVNNDSPVTVQVSEAKATRANGYLNLKIKNNSDKDKKTKYIKVNLINELNQTSVTKYSNAIELDTNSEKNFKLNFRGTHIKRYSIEVIDEIPEEDLYALSFFGWDLNAKNFLGLDLTNVMGTGINVYSPMSKIDDYMVNVTFQGFVIMASSSYLAWAGPIVTVPMWGYMLATMFAYFH